MSNNKGNKMKIKTILIGCLFFCVSFLDLFGQSSRGEKAFLENNPEEAILFLEEEINSGIASSKAYNFLGLAYFQLGNFEESIKAFEKGLKVPTTNKKIIAYNQGNTYYKMGKYLEAADAFSLAYSADSSFTDALLNRANAYLMAQKYQETVNDYTKYLYLCPEDDQRPQIEQILALLQQEIVRQAEEEKRLAEEAARLAEEEKRLAEEMERQRLEQERLEEERRRAEEERLAAEKAAEEERLAAERAAEEKRLAEEAERRRKLLEDVANSLHKTDSTNMSSGTEDIIEYEQESELD